MAMDGSGERRQGNLEFEPDTGLLVVGTRTAVLDPKPEPRAVVGTYVELVVAQREVVPLTHIDLRNRELVQLSSLLALPQDELDELIDRELVRLLSGATPTALAAGIAAPTGWSAKRRLFVFGGITVAALATALGVTIATQGSTVEVPGTTATGGGGSVEVIELEGGGTATRTESDPAPVAEDGTDVGTAVVIERNP
jgi:hypothetical protein